MKKPLLIISIFAAVFVQADESRYDEELLSNFQAAQINLERGIENFCSGTSNEAPLAQWKATAEAWLLVDALQLPATEFMQTDYQFIFWPDPKDRLRKQVRNAFSTEVSEVDWTTLTSAAKSLSAIEYSFTQKSSEEDCEWLQVITKHQLTLTEQLLSLQSLYDFSTPEKLTALQGTALSLHAHYKDMLARPGKVIWQLGPAWRSDSVWEIQFAMVNQIQTLLSDFNQDHSGVSEWQQKLSVLNLTDEKPTLDTLLALDAFLVELARYIENTLAPELDVYLGFNNFDGD